jgi:hypothetical protein
MRASLRGADDKQCGKYGRSSREAADQELRLLRAPAASSAASGDQAPRIRYRQRRHACTSATTPNTADTK